MANHPTPTAIKKATGNPGKRPLNEQEPTPPNGIPDCPSSFSGESKRVWKQLVTLLDGMGVLSVADGVALERLCDCYAEILACKRLVRKHGRVYKTTSQMGDKVLKANPAVSQLADADRRFSNYLDKFGLTPSARTKIALNPKEKEKDPLEEFFAN